MIKSKYGEENYQMNLGHLAPERTLKINRVILKGQFEEAPLVKDSKV